MPHSFSVKESRLFCEGDGLDFLRLKTKLAGFLGNSTIQSVDPRTFSLPITAAIAASALLREAGGTMPAELTEASRVYENHKSARDEIMTGLLENRILPLEEPWPGILDPAQAVAVSAMTNPGLLGLCLFDEQGIGKSVMTLASFDILFQRKQTDCLVIVCPVTMMQTWQKEIETFLPGKYRVEQVKGSPDEKRRIVLSGFDILICNFESVPPLLVPMKAVLGNKKATLAVDESFNIKNKDAYRSVAIRDLRGVCSKGFVMCGTPAPNSPVDVIHQFDVADDGYTFAGFTIPKDEAERTKRIAEQIEDRGTFVRRLKAEVLPMLPEKQFNVVQVTMSGRQESLYEDARGKLELSLKGMDNATFKKSLATYFQQRSALLQICACPEVVDPSFADAAAKMTALDQLVEEVVEQGGKKLIIWSFYRASLRNIFERYERYSPVLLDGSSSASARAESVDKFQQDSDTRICVANPAAAGAGVTLHAASDAAYVSFSNQAAHFLQSVDRIHRRGQQASSTNYHLIVCKDTIEETEVKRLRAKEVRQHELLGDQVKWPNSLDEALSELKQQYE